MKGALFLLWRFLFCKTDPTIKEFHNVIVDGQGSPTKTDKKTRRNWFAF